VINWTARRAAARAFLAHDLKRGRAWHTLTYGYEMEHNGMKYFVWHDIDTKKSDERKAAEAAARYVARFGQSPANVYTQAEQAQVQGTIAPGALWLGPVEDAL
jgi:hypothetical protein